ncbi:nitrite reductase large subunit NirB [Pelagibaculum spongiae]|uniref:Nitrite reductase (NAD(P)H) n=1 Tax=Pelagibaculum spongiae TaxID=2080658 RepID=A0A2V1GVK6_9GAMM|nr:nitrite reductase large subunit NirB [Pelagibaculum spongiae]PVZ70425.1 nitrite reductase (NAD(P)H) [Pelagibaculum spongiae]
MDKQNLVIIGNGMVGHHLVEQLVQHNLHQQFNLTVVGEEVRPAYDRVHLSALFDGKTADDLALTTADYYQKNNIQLILGNPVISIQRDKRLLVCESGGLIAWDKLVMATGSAPFVPPVPGRENPGCLVYRTIEDLQSIQEAAETATVGVVVGGGLLGLEAANAIKNLGLETHVVEFAPQLMPAQLDSTAGKLLERKITELGVKVHTNKNTKEIVNGSQSLLQMNFTDETQLSTDLIVFSAGIRPRDQLARDCDLTVGPRGGIEVDQQLTTSDSNIYAIGECALFDGKIFGLVAPGYTMARTLASHLAGETAAFTGADMSTKLKLLGVDVAAIGDGKGIDAQLNYKLIDDPAGVYKKLVISDDQKKLNGALLIGNVENYDTLLAQYLNQIDLPKDPVQLITPAKDGEQQAIELPGNSIICSCHNVSRDAINQAMDDGLLTLDEVKDETRASTGCGGCSAAVKTFVDQQLAKRGMEVSVDICPHFSYSRQQLFHLAKVGDIQDFDNLIAQHGTGAGCDICKPTAASIFASLENQYILDRPHRTLQDTNDRFLANIQKNGSYSVVPRIPGGEITPDKLIVIGQVAKKFDLYTKITGGQRIDLFGARLEQLPEIWQQLINAGFESGHAYGKSLRTVKSCVGSDWCRYGVQDSMGMAIELENRYKGLRSPHKIKFAVSGCTRECAEAQSKDIGVIATENGWNLYVCGNGGMKPRHAELFATDLDDQQLIKLIDRVLMFYIETAERLQRTSVWREQLDGGLGYLKSVVIEDSLGIAEQLEQQMQKVVGSYQCEWEATLNDQERLKQFQPFVNSKQADPSIQFDRKREQIIPLKEIS